jgi:hypothetical protein
MSKAWQDLLDKVGIDDALEDLDAHLITGSVLIHDDCVVMARPVRRSDDRARISNPAVGYSWDECDCWHVHWLSGGIRAFLDAVPAHRVLPFVSFFRRGKLRIYRYETFTNRRAKPWA